MRSGFALLYYAIGSGDFYEGSHSLAAIKAGLINVGVGSISGSFDRFITLFSARDSDACSALPQANVPIYFVIPI